MIGRSDPFWLISDPNFAVQIRVTDQRNNRTGRTISSDSRNAIGDVGFFSHFHVRRNPQRCTHEPPERRRATSCGCKAEDHESFDSFERRTLTKPTPKKRKKNNPTISMDGPANAVANAGVTFAVFLFLSHANVEETAAVSEARVPAHL